jgi:5-formyltetrahydrofolate cyclo-ligase
LAGKDEIRAKMLARRKALSPEERRLRSRAIEIRLYNREIFRRSRSVQFYVSGKHEVDTSEMINRAIEMGKTVAVPFFIEDRNEIGLTEIRNGSARMAKNALGFSEPEPSSVHPLDPDRIELWIVPGVAFDPTGNRIGLGKGYYDRLLSDARTGHRVGIAYDFQILDSIPAEAHDVRMNEILTETRTIHIEQNPGPENPG